KLSLRVIVKIVGVIKLDSGGAGISRDFFDLQVLLGDGQPVFLLTKGQGGNSAADHQKTASQQSHIGTSNRMATSVQVGGRTERIYNKSKVVTRGDKPG